MCSPARAAIFSNPSMLWVLPQPVRRETSTAFIAYSALLCASPQRVSYAGFAWLASCAVASLSTACCSHPCASSTSWASVCRLDIECSTVPQHLRNHVPGTRSVANQVFRPDDDHVQRPPAPGRCVENLRGRSSWSAPVLHDQEVQVALVIHRTPRGRPEQDDPFRIHCFHYAGDYRVQFGLVRSLPQRAAPCRLPVPFHRLLWAPVCCTKWTAVH